MINDAMTMGATAYRTLADLTLITHVGFVAFAVLGLLLILIGGVGGWRWIRNPWFRASHLAGVALVVVQAWLGIVCPLTTLEMFFREQAGESTYRTTFIAHWLQELLYYDAPGWAFVVCYTTFGLAVVASWVKFRPRSFRARAE
jgi:glucan phosphoethanolaminetransferase (alkaline phosphatase superfamily)